MSDRRRTFERAYYSTVALLAVALACLPSIGPLTFLLLGFDPRIRDAQTSESYEAYRATAPLRRGFAFGVLALALGVIALSVATAVLRLKGRTNVAMVVLVIVILAAIATAMVVFASLLAPGGMCC